MGVGITMGMVAALTAVMGMNAGIRRGGCRQILVGGKMSLSCAGSRESPFLTVGVGVISMVAWAAFA